MGILHMFKTYLNRSTKSDGAIKLERLVDEAEQLTDPGERLVAWKQLSETRDALIQHKQDGYLPPLLMIGVLGASVGLAVGLAFATGSFLGLLPMLGFGTILKGADLLSRADATVKACAELSPRIDGGLAEATTGDPLRYAASPKFDDVMQAFPDLKEKFVLAAAHAVAQAPAIQPPPSAPGAAFAP